MQNLDETEEGEISGDADSDIEPYTALERPTTLAPVHQPFRQIIEDTDGSSEFSSSSEDSSDDEFRRPAKRRKKIEPKVKKATASSGKHNVWSSVVFEDHIEQELKDINVHHSKNYLDRSRDVESYNYSLCFSNRLETEDLDLETEKKIRKKLADLDKRDGNESFAKEEETLPEDYEQSLKQTQQLLNSRKRKMDQRESHSQKTPRRPKPLRVEELSVTQDATELEVAQDITLKLHEEKMDLILRAVQILGKQCAIDLFNETREAENDGGIMVADGSRRRTPGGVYLFLLRNHDTIPMEKIREVFSEESKEREKHKRFLRAKRRQGQAEKLKKSLQESGDLPTLPSRVELELSNVAKAREAAEVAMDLPEQSTKEEPSAVAHADIEDVVDINFDCE